MNTLKDNVEVKGFELEKNEINALANCLAPFIKSFFTSEEGQKEFKEWQKWREKKCEQ